MAIIYGVPVSAYVRKAMLAHAYKGVNYELKLTSPGSDEPEFAKISPMKKIPAYQTDDGFGFSDSSIIIAYLEKTSPNNKLYPDTPNAYAKALWFEEYCDTKLSEILSALYYQRVIGPAFFNHETDNNRVDELINNLIPEKLTYLESQLNENEWLIENTFSVADLSLGIHFMSLAHANYSVDANSWPKLANYVERFMDLDIVKQQMETEKAVFAN